MKLWLALWMLAAPLAAGTRVAPLEAEASSARAAAFGGAGLLLDHRAAWVQAPASLAGEEAWSLRAHHQGLLLGVQRQFLEGSLGLGSWGGLGLGLGQTSFGDLESRDDAGLLLGSLASSRLSGALGWGVTLGEGVSVGLALAAFRQAIGQDSFSGAHAIGHARWTRGPLSADAAASQDQAAAALGLRWPDEATLFGVQAGSDKGRVGFSGGAERAMGPLQLRAGARFNEGVLSPAAGLGFHLQSYGLDYAWLPLGILGDSHRVSLSYVPLKPKPVLAPEPSPLPTPEPTPLPLPEDLPPPLPDLSAPQPATATAGPALELEFRLPESTADKAIMADEEGGEAQALALYQEAIKLNPSDTRAWLGLGHLYYRRKDLDSALQCFEQVLRLNPTETALREWVDQAKARRKALP